MRQPKRRTRSILHLIGTAAAAVAAWQVAAIARADADWGSMSYTLFRDMQAVNADGSAAWSVPLDLDSPSGQAYKLLGVVLNNPGDMLDSTPNYMEGPMWAMGGQWQVYVQTVDPSDFGGAACWMGQNYGNHYWHWQYWDYNYTNEEWQDEVDRVGLNGTLQAGDLIEVRARGGLFYKGKFNVNEQHDNDPAFNFDVIRLGHPGLPTPEDIELSDVKNPDGGNPDANFIFQQDRLAGAEHYQATLVNLQDVSLVSSAGWGPDADLVVTDGEGRHLTMKLGLTGFDQVLPPWEPFDVVGIFDQESGDYTGGYRLWVMDASQFSAIPEPSSIVLAIGSALGLLAFALRRRRRRSG